MDSSKKKMARIRKVALKQTTQQKLKAKKQRVLNKKRNRENSALKYSKQRRSYNFPSVQQVEAKSLVYYDIGAWQEPVFPFNQPENQVYLKKYVGIDPRFESNQTNGKYVIYNCAAYDENTTKKLYFSSGERKEIPGLNASLLDYTNLHFFCPSNINNTTDVQCKKLSDIIEEQGGEIDILKIDAHGSEMPILRNIEKYLKHITAIDIESWCLKWYKDHELFDVVHEFLISRKFLLSRFIQKWDGTEFGLDDQIYAIELLYINQHADTDKSNLVKQLYEVKDDSAIEAKAEVENIINLMEKKNNV